MSSSSIIANTSIAMPKQSKLPLQWWLPDVRELFLYVVVVLLTYLFGALMYYNSIQRQVKRTSSCYQNNFSISNGSYFASAVNDKNKPLYKVGYNFPAKSYSVDCACTPGNIANTFPNIDVFNLATQTVQTIPNKMCSCDQQYYNPPTNTIYFTGYPGVVRFMNTSALYGTTTEKQAKADTTFFDTALNGPVYSGQ
jgi:hypothetical protein